MLPDSTTAILPLSRLTRLYDGLEQLEDMWGDESEDDLDSFDSIGASDHSDSGVWALDENGNWVVTAADGEDWSTDNEDDVMSVDAERWSSPPASTIQPSKAESIVSMLVAGDDKTPILVSDIPSPPTVSVTLATRSPPAESESSMSNSIGQGSTDSNDASPWRRFEVLASAPTDHAFYGSTPAQPSRSFLARLTKEYRVLESSLPGRS